MFYDVNIACYQGYILLVHPLLHHLFEDSTAPPTLLILILNSSLCMSLTYPFTLQITSRPMLKY